MEALFEVRPIHADSMRAAYAVALLTTPDLSFADFKKIAGAGRPGARTCALKGLFDRRNYVHALFRSTVETRFDSGFRLKIYDLLLSDSISTTFLSQMVDACEAYARVLGCDQMTIETARPDRSLGLPLSDVLTMRGFSGETIMMARRI